MLQSPRVPRFVNSVPLKSGKIFLSTFSFVSLLLSDPPSPCTHEIIFKQSGTQVSPWYLNSEIWKALYSGKHVGCAFLKRNQQNLCAPRWEEVIAGVNPAMEREQATECNKQAAAEALVRLLGRLFI